MPRVRSIEQRIHDLEGFAVKLTTLEGVNLRSDRDVPNQYDDHQRRAADSMTVEDWKRVRFRPQFAGLAVQVLDGNGAVVHGRTQLRKVRASYR